MNVEAVQSTYILGEPVLETPNERLANAKFNPEDLKKLEGYEPLNTIDDIHLACMYQISKKHQLLIKHEKRMMDACAKAIGVEEGDEIEPEEMRQLLGFVMTLKPTDEEKESYPNAGAITKAFEENNKETKKHEEDMAKLNARCRFGIEKVCYDMSRFENNESNDDVQIIEKEEEKEGNIVSAAGCTTKDRSAEIQALARQYEQEKEKEKENGERLKDMFGMEEDVEIKSQNQDEHNEVVNWQIDFTRRQREPAPRFHYSYRPKKRELNEEQLKLIVSLSSGQSTSSFTNGEPCCSTQSHQNNEIVEEEMAERFRKIKLSKKNKRNKKR